MYQMPNTQHHLPNYGSAPPQMKVDAHGSPLPYETPQAAFNHGHPIPMGYHGCCNYGYVPVFYPPPPPFYHHGTYPAYPPLYPVHYPLPPYYPIDQPRYEFDKNQLTDHHSCGCPGHQCNKKVDRPVKIEQQEPDNENTYTNYLALVEPRSHPCQLVCVPPVNMETFNEPGKPTETELKHKVQNPSDLTIKNNVNIAEEIGQNQMEVNSNQFPFPIFWLPFKGFEEGKEYHRESDLSGTKRDNNMIEPKEREARVGIDAGSVEMKKKISNQKLIPVKQMGEKEEKRDKEIVKEKGDGETKLKLIPIKQVEENGKIRDKEIVKGNGKSDKKLSDDVNKSKLPPVCLRVEPLRKKRLGSNGNSRSPSPTRSENKPVSSDQTEKNEANSTEMEGKVIEVVDGKTKENTQGDERLEGSKIFENEEKMAVEAEESEVTNMLEKTNKRDTSTSEKTVKGATIILDKMEKANCEWQDKARKKLSEVEAAVIIQSAYRGFEVRRWDPLKKLKQISEIREKAAEIKGRIEALEASADCSNYDKQRVFIGETIMGLLLKLDTIQGLHPIVRVIRKSVAKELVSLENQLDSLGNKFAFSTTKVGEDPTGGQAKAELGHDNSVEASQAIVQEVIEKEIREEAEESTETVSSPCQLNDEGAKEITSSESVNFIDEKESSVELVGGIQDDMCNHETITQTNDAEPVLDAGSVSEVKVLSCAGDALTDQPSVCHREFSVEEDQDKEQISMEGSDRLQGGDFKTPSVDVIDTMAITQESQVSAAESKDDVNCEMYMESDDLHRVVQEHISGDAQEEEFRCLEKQECGEKLQGDLEGEGASIISDLSHVVATKPEQPLPEPSLEKHAVEDAMLKESHGEDEALNPEDVDGCEMELDKALSEENQEHLENKYIVESPNVVNNKHTGRMENVNSGKKVEIANEMRLGSDKDLVEENEKLREMVAKLVEAGKEQLSVVSTLAGRVKDLEMKLGRKKKPKLRRSRVGSSCVKPSDHSAKESAQGVAV